MHAVARLLYLAVDAAEYASPYQQVNLEFMKSPQITYSASAQEPKVPDDIKHVYFNNLRIEAILPIFKPFQLSLLISLKQ